MSNLTTPTQMKIFLFRNYNLPPSVQSQYNGTTKYKVWEAVRASSAAPGYYEAFKLDGYVFHVSEYRKCTFMMRWHKIKKFNKYL